MKKASGLKKKQFIILIVSVCVVALIAEGILIAHTFSAGKEKDKHKPTPTPTKEPFSYGMWIPVSHTYLKEDGTVLEMETYDYDNEGRVILVRCFDGEEQLVYEEKYTYDKNGTKTETFVEKEHTERIKTSIGGMTVNHKDGESYECLYDNDGYIKKITKYKNADGTKIPVELMKRFYSGGRLSGEDLYAMDDESGEWVLKSEKEYRYDGDNTIEIRGGEVKVYCGGRFVEMTDYFDPDRTDPIDRVTRYRLFPSRLDCLQNIEFMKEWMSEYEPRQAEIFQENVTALIARWSVEFNPEGLPVKMYRGYFRTDDHLEVYREYRYDEKNRIIQIRGKEQLPGYMSRAPREMETLIAYDDDDNPVEIKYDNIIHRLEWKLIPYGQ